MIERKTSTKNLTFNVCFLLTLLTHCIKAPPIHSSALASACFHPMRVSQSGMFHHLITFELNWSQLKWAKNIFAYQKSFLWTCQIRIGLARNFNDQLQGSETQWSVTIGHEFLNANFSVKNKLFIVACSNETSDWKNLEHRMYTSLWQSTDFENFGDKSCIFSRKSWFNPQAAGAETNYFHSHWSRFSY